MPLRHKANSKSTSNPKLSEDQMEELKEAFHLFDTKQRGYIDGRELKAAIRALGFDIRKEDLVDMLGNLGLEDAHQVNFDQFVMLMSTKVGMKNTREEIDKIFNLFDEDKTGKITFRNLKKISQELGEGLADTDIQDMIDEADRTGDGTINRDEFYRIMRRRGDNIADYFTSDEEEED